MDAKRWCIDVSTEIGAEFTMLPERIRIRPVSSSLVSCGVCVVHRHRELGCCDLPNCDDVTLLPVDDAELMAEVARMRLTNQRAPSQDMSIPLAERKVAPCDSSST